VVLVPASPSKLTSEVEASAEVKVDFKNIKSEKDRIAFLESLGWKVSDNAPKVIEITIPEVFDGVFADYNNLQKSVGLDLEKYKGKKATLYTYELVDDEEKKVANIIVYKNKIIGGDVSSPLLDGFIQGLSKK
ncbi:MAG: DUF4830 domain-containing protein, partial [Clostridia bacterium]|nr:DUF4830 domain-containing protein [Clostridia bacterium]